MGLLGGGGSYGYLERDGCALFRSTVHIVYLLWTYESETVVFLAAGFGTEEVYIH